MKQFLTATVRKTLSNRIQLITNSNIVWKPFTDVAIRKSIRNTSTRTTLNEKNSICCAMANKGLSLLFVFLIPCLLAYFLTFIAKEHQLQNIASFSSSVGKMSSHDSDKAKRALLPKHFHPKRYHLHFTPDLKNFTFLGEETVEVDVKEATAQMIIHSLDIKIESVEFHEGGNVHKPKSITYQEKEETVTFDFETALKVGSGTLKIKYQGNLNDQMIGFYRSKYTVGNETRYMATTQMEPTGARRAFPGWDEPAYKAVFDISITAGEHYTVLSNMEPEKEAKSNGLKTITFKPTPIMSTYLVAFVVGEFDHVEGKTKEGTIFRVFTPLGKKTLGEFSLDVGIKVLSYFNEYYGIPYPLNKMDMIAIADFAAGAMENWGLVTYRETALLIDAKNSGVSQKQRVAYVVAHELAHQWFGNLVTMDWWKELWLNEGFATFVGNQAIDVLFPEWDIWTQFVSQYVNKAQLLDGLENSHPIEVEVYSSAQIDEIFDAISYSKGASVIRMVSNLIGEEKFRKGLNIYLNRFKYKNAVTEDLWQALGESSGFPVKEFMDKYTKTTGYPLVSISSTANPEEFLVEQRRFFSSGKVQSEAEAQQWWVNIAVSTSNSKERHLHDLKTKSATLKFPEVKGSEWFKANAGQSGFYRVKYSGMKSKSYQTEFSADISSKLTKALNNLSLPTVDRIGVQADAFALALSGDLPTVEALQLAKAYVNEVDYTVWSDLAGSLGQMCSVWSNDSSFDNLKKFQRNLFGPIGNKLGFDPKPDESALTTLLRAVVLNVLSNSDEPNVIAEAKKRFERQQKHNEPISADLRFLCYKTVVAHGTKEDYEEVLKIFRTADLHEEKLRALRALGYTENKELLTRTLQMGLSDEVRSQDIFYVTAGVTSHSLGSWEFFQNNFEEYNKRLGQAMMLMDRLVEYTLANFASEEKVNEIEKFFTAHPVPSAERTIKQAIEKIRANTKWLNNNREAVAKYLAEQ